MTERENMNTTEFTYILQPVMILYCCVHTFVSCEAFFLKNIDTSIFSITLKTGPRHSGFHLTTATEYVCNQRYHTETHK